MNLTPQHPDSLGKWCHDRGSCQCVCDGYKGCVWQLSSPSGHLIFMQSNGIAHRTLAGA